MAGAGRLPHAPFDSKTTNPDSHLPQSNFYQPSQQRNYAEDGDGARNFYSSAPSKRCGNFEGDDLAQSNSAASRSLFSGSPRSAMMAFSGRSGPYDLDAHRPVAMRAQVGATSFSSLEGSNGAHPTITETPPSPPKQSRNAHSAFQLASEVNRFATSHPAQLTSTYHKDEPGTAPPGFGQEQRAQPYLPPHLRAQRAAQAQREAAQREQQRLVSHPGEQRSQNEAPRPYLPPHQRQALQNVQRRQGGEMTIGKWARNASSSSFSVSMPESRGNRTPSPLPDKSQQVPLYLSRLSAFSLAPASSRSARLEPGDQTGLQRLCPRVQKQRKRRFQSRHEVRSAAVPHAVAQGPLESLLGGARAPSSSPCSLFRFIALYYS